jgi:hypothetical protein
MRMLDLAVGDRKGEFRPASLPNHRFLQLVATLPPKIGTIDFRHADGV